MRLFKGRARRKQARSAVRADARQTHSEAGTVGIKRSDLIEDVLWRAQRDLFPTVRVLDRQVVGGRVDRGHVHRPALR